MDWRFNTIWFDDVPEGRVEFMNPSDYGILNFDRSTIEYLVSNSFKSQSKNIQDLPAGDSLLYLELNKANIESLNGISKFTKLKRLEMHYCLKLGSDKELGSLKDTLEWIHISQSKNFSYGEDLLSLSKLKVLCLNNCAPLPNLSFLSNFPSLLDFRFVGTNIESGDLTPLLNHPTLCSAGFLDKRHYNLKSAEVSSALAQKKAAAIARVHKEQYETFRYLAVGT